MAAPRSLPVTAQPSGCCVGCLGPSTDAWWASSVGSLPVLGWMGRRWVAPPALSVAGGVAASHLFFHLSPERLNFGLPGCVGPQESGL